jgi:hypothetical protein
MRVKRRCLPQSSVGAIIHRRGARGAPVDDRHTAELDFQLATSSFLGSDNLDFNGFFVKTPNPGRPRTRRRVRLCSSITPTIRSARRWNSVKCRRTTTRAVGFTDASGFREYDPRVTFSPRPRQHPWIRNFNFEGEYDLFVDPITNRTQTREFDVTLLEIETHSQDSFKVGVTPTYERLDEDFDIAQDITLPVGNEYSFTRYTVEAQTAWPSPDSRSSRRSSGEASIRATVCGRRCR